MLIHANEAIRTVVHGDALPWVASPQGGVQRRMLSRVGGEVALATSIVRYDKGASFAPHTHELGEEYVVLDGVFQDERGDHPAGHYVRNPPGSRHTPRADQGATIFVKLRHMHPSDCAQVHTDMPNGPGTHSLHSDEREWVGVVHSAQGQVWQDTFAYGAELLVLQGHLLEGGDALRPWSWMRLPAGSSLNASVVQGPAKVWLKRYVQPRG